MNLSVKITAFAATVLAMAVFFHAPNADAKSTDTAKAKKSTKTIVVEPGDSLSSIAEKYHTTWTRLYDANKDVIDPDLIHPGEKIVIPDAKVKLESRLNTQASDVVTTVTPSQSYNYSYASPVSSASYAVTTGNAYDWGQCTWYVKNKRPDIGSFWGNAGYSWISSARAAGFATGSAPHAGAVGVMAGHVVYVESVHGSMVSVSEMNWNGGVGVVNYRTAPASNFSYIY